jgi:hypothetical protein
VDGVAHVSNATCSTGCVACDALSDSLCDKDPLRVDEVYVAAIATALLRAGHIRIHLCDYHERILDGALAAYGETSNATRQSN